MTTEYRHTPVMAAEVFDALSPHEGEIFVDATLGGAGHALSVVGALGSSGAFIGIDQDGDAIAAARERLDASTGDGFPEILIVHRNFRDLDSILLDAEVPGIDGILFDLGVSSYQFDTPSRGFSYKADSLPDMRMDSGKQTKNAAEIINTTNEADLARIIRDNSDEPWAGRIAHSIVKARQEAEIVSTSRLASIIRDAIPARARRRGKNPARRTFQALRIATNDELGALRQGLDSAIRWLNPGGRIAVISYHSLEDRIVKETFNSFVDRCICPADLPVCACGRMPILEIVSRHPYVPTAHEISRNPRARSAKLRVARKI